MTVQEYLDQLADKLLTDAMDGTMPPAIKRQVQELIDRVQTEMNIYGHVQTRIPPEVLAMPWERFSGKLTEIEKLLRSH